MENMIYEAPKAEILSFENDYVFAALQRDGEPALDSEARGNTSYVPV